jgi:hypothetical protein
MPKRRLLWHLFPSYALLALATVLAVWWVAAAGFERSFLGAARADLRSGADFLDKQLGSSTVRDLAADVSNTVQVASVEMEFPGGLVDGTTF